MRLILCALSAKRRAALEEDPTLFSDVLDEGDVPGLLDLDKTWDALDVMLSDRGADALMGDALLARSGARSPVWAGYGPGRVLAPARVTEVAAALSALPDTFVRDRYPALLFKDAYGNYGQETCADDDVKFIKDSVLKIRSEEAAELEAMLRRVIALYQRAAAAGHAMLSLMT
jgi:hypothetical protein